MQTADPLDKEHDQTQDHGRQRGDDERDGGAGERQERENPWRE
jgi:hypothetical protein